MCTRTKLCVHSGMVYTGHCVPTTTVYTHSGSLYMLAVCAATVAGVCNSGSVCTVAGGFLHLVVLQLTDHAVD